MSSPYDEFTFPGFAEYWGRYTNKFYQQFKHGGCNLNDTSLKSFLKDAHTNLPEEAIVPEMYTKKPEKRTAYGRCTLALACIPNNCNFQPEKFIFPPNQTSCLSAEYKNKFECNIDTERRLEVSLLRVKSVRTFIY